MTTVPGKYIPDFENPPHCRSGKGFHHVRCGFALRKPNGVFSRGDPDIFLKEDGLSDQGVSRQIPVTQKSDLSLRFLFGHWGRYLRRQAGA
jgi:hypothetical protein